MNIFRLAAAVAVALPMLFVSCESSEPSDLAAASPAGIPYASVFRVPIHPAHLHAGEEEALSVEAISSQNAFIFDQVIDQLIADLRSGTLPAHPADPSETTDVPPLQYGPSVLNKIAGRVEDFDALALKLCVEIGYEGMGYDGYSHQQPDWLRIVFQDPSQILPDMNVVRIEMEDLQSYRVATSSGEFPLPVVLAGADLEGYILRASSEMGVAVVKSYAEALEQTGLIERGAIDQLNYLPAEM